MDSLVLTVVGLGTCLAGPACFEDAGNGAGGTEDGTSASDPGTTTSGTSSSEPAGSSTGDNTTGDTTTGGTTGTTGGTTGTTGDTTGTTGTTGDNTDTTGTTSTTGDTTSTSGDTTSTSGDTTSSTDDTTSSTGGTTSTTGGALCPPGAPELLNGDFSTTDHWSVSNGAEITGGVLAMNGIDVCDGGGALQTLCVPLFEDLFGPYALRMDAAIDDGCFDCEYTAVVFESAPTGTSRVRTHVPYAQSGNHSFCLGEAAYGGDIDFFVGGMVPGGCSNFAKTLDLDNLVLEPAAPVECPAPGTVLNGDMQLGNAGWNITTATNGASVTWQGASDLEMIMDLPGGVCSTARVTGQISVPLTTTVPNAAVTFTATAAGSFNLRFMNGDVAANQSFVGTEQEESYTWCMPSELAGGVFTAQLEISNSGSCAGMQARQLVSDDFTITSDQGNCP